MRSSFLAEYIKDFRRVGAVAPSSRYLARKMVRSIDFGAAEVIVEYGAGTGVFTAAIVERMQPHTTLVVLETNPSFYKTLQQRFKDMSRVIVLNESAEHVGAILEKHSLAAPNYIVSGLPFASLPANTSHTIMKETTRLLGDGGTFVTFQYTLMKQAFFRSYFKHIQVTREWRNIPPAYILYCK